jgi:hypothetical protein
MRSPNLLEHRFQRGQLDGDRFLGLVPPLYDFFREVNALRP